jgi:hypothetical protein
MSSAVLMIMSFTSCAVKLGLAAKTRAAIPVTIGAVGDVAVFKF